MPVDRTRHFALPGIQNLSKDQDEALALPEDGRHLIIGGPGTGKSVVALLRARRLAEKQATYRFLVYNNVLHESNTHLFGKEQNFNAATWDPWFRDICQYFIKSVPTLEPDYPGGFQPINWDAVLHQVQNLKDIGDHSQKFLLIDEGQDMPPAFYETLINLGFENFYVVADGNQQLEPDQCSSRRDIEDLLAIEPTDTIELKTNYRNTLPIAKLAQHFYPDDPASPKPELPISLIADATPELWRYDDKNHPSLDEIVVRILNLSDRFPNKLIGIITPNNTVREKFYNSLARTTPTLDNEKPAIQTYFSKDENKISLNFNIGGIMVLNAQSCKGLEFDIVILADIDKHQPKKNIYTMKSRFYVMVARGREQVILLRTGATCHVIESLLPTDPTILVRKE